MCNLKYYNITRIFSPTIFRASYKGDINELTQLISTGVDINVYDRKGLTPLMVACLRGKSGAVKLLIENGATVNAQDNNGLTALTHALQDSWLRRGLRRLTNILTTAPFDNQSNFMRNYYSGAKRDNEIAEMLISNGADINLVDSKKMTPLMYAAVLGNEEIVALLLTRGANVNAKNRDGATALMLAILGGWLKIVEKLIEYGSDVNYCNNDGISVMAIALFKNNKEILELLRAKGAKDEVTSCSLRK